MRTTSHIHPGEYTVNIYKNQQFISQAQIVPLFMRNRKKQGLMIMLGVCGAGGGEGVNTTLI